MLLEEFREVRCPVFGMLHLPALPGSPNSRLSREDRLDWVLRDAAALTEGGIDGLIIENFGDTPFYPGTVPPMVAAEMARLANEVRKRFPVPLGINVLRNDALTALAVANAVGAQFIRVNILCGTRLTDQGIIHGQAHELLRQRASWQAADINILADLQVKHSGALVERDICEEARETVERGGADGLIISGSVTGAAADGDQFEQVRNGGVEVPILVGSGVTLKSIRRWSEIADGLIIGTSLKQDGQLGRPVDVDRVRRMMAEIV